MKKRKNLLLTEETIAQLNDAARALGFVTSRGDGEERPNLCALLEWLAPHALMAAKVTGRVNREIRQS